jgi:hypothetical protein
MTLDEIDQFLVLLESETPTTHSGWMRLKEDATTCMIWLKQAEFGHTAPWLEENARRLFDRAIKGIESYVAKPRLCLNPLSMS